MKHTMKLRPNPFRMILCGEKTYELRLYEENIFLRIIRHFN